MTITALPSPSLTSPALTSPALATLPVFPSRLLPAADFEVAIDEYLLACQARDAEINAFAAEVNTAVTDMNQLVTDLNTFVSQVNSQVVLTTVIAKMTGTQASSSTSLSNITALVCALEANATYEVTAYVKFQSAATTTGLNLGFTVPTGATPFLEVEVPIVNTAAASALKLNHPAAGSTTAGNVTGTGTTAINSDHTATIKGVVSMGGTAGNLQLQFASEVGSSAVTLQVGSILVVKRVG